MSSATNAEALKFKEGDSLAFPLLHAHTTDKMLLASSDGRFYTLAADRLPGGRGFGEPVKLMVDIEGEGNVVALLRGGASEKLLVASSDGRGFITAAAGRDRRNPQGQADRQSAPRRDAQGGAPDRAGRRLCRGDRREPQDGRLSARRAARNGPRPGRPAPALPRRRPLRRDRLRLRGGAQLGDGRRDRPHPHRDRHEPVAHRPRRRRPHAPIGFPRDNQF